MNVERVYKVKEGRPHVVDLIKGDRVQLVINTPHGQEPWFDEKAIRRATVTHRIPTITTLAAAWAGARPDADHAMKIPPLTSITEPVMYPPSSDARNAMAAATSCGVPARPSGMFFAISTFFCSPWSAAIAVSM